MLNGISRVASTAAAAAAAAVSSATDSPAAASRSNARMRKPAPEEVIEEYDFCEESAVPTIEEVEAASKELHKTFAEPGPTSGHAAEAVNANEVVITEVSTNTNPAAENPCKEVVGCSKADNTVVSQSNAAVVQCVDLFQRNPDVQAAVMSLARDPAVWDAFVRNEKVQELLRGGRGVSRRSTFEGSSLDLLEHHTNPFVIAMHCLKSTLWDVLDSVVDVVHGVFEFVDRKIFGGRESEPLDRPLKACMVLTILLFSLVLLNRSRRL